MRAKLIEFIGSSANYNELNRFNDHEHYGAFAPDLAKKRQNERSFRMIILWKFFNCDLHVFQWLISSPDENSHRKFFGLEAKNVQFVVDDQIKST